MSIKVISYGKHGNTAQIVIHHKGYSQTKHLRKIGGFWFDNYETQYELPKN